jgi:hypothetical protein
VIGGEIMAKKQNQRFLTFQQLMDELQIGSINTVYKMQKNGLPVISIGRLKRVDRRDLEKFLESHTVK